MRADDLILALPLACFGVPAFAILVLFGFLVRRNLSAAGQSQMLSDGEMWLDTELSGLLPSRPASLSDVSDSISYVYTRFVSEKTRGSVKSVSQDRALIAFYTISGFHGLHILARTTAHR
ncbi:MAG: hypothetical protein M3Q29_07865 [Chloroflexota bacterium]|nr:hypothetical protein [Chloroflexota bacterium]